MRTSYQAFVFLALLVSFLQANRAVAWESQSSRQSRTHTISGFVLDVQSGESLIDANVYAPEFRIGTTTNQYGFFSLSVDADSVNLVVSHIGYTPVTFVQLLTEDLQLNIELEPTATELDEIEVVATGESVVEAVQISQIRLPIETIRALPVLAGELDIFKTLQLLPGVQSGREGASGLYVRGGGPDQNLVLLDGATVYNANHLFGFLSVFNGDAIKDVNLIKGGFPARYGGRLSSVIDLSMKEGNLKEFEGTASVGIVSSSFTVQGPIRKNKSSFIVAARRTYLDLLAYPFLNDKYRTGYYFYDTSAKVNFILSRKDRIYFSFYGGHDRLYSSERYRKRDINQDQRNKGNLSWRNMTATARWNRIYGPRLFSNMLVGFTRYRLGTNSEDEIRPLNNRSNIIYFRQEKFLSGITDGMGRLDFEFIPNPIHHVRFGFGGIVHAYHTGTFSERQYGGDIAPIDTIYDPDYLTRSVEVHAYLEDDFQVTNNLKMNLGLRSENFFVNRRTYTSIQPRLSIRWKLSNSTALKISLASMRQYIHLLSATSGLSLPIDLWVPPTDQVKPQRANQVAAGLAWSSLDNMYEATLEGYYKTMNSLIEYKEGVVTYGISGEQWKEKIETGRGWSYGGELLVRKKIGRITGWVGYSLTKTLRRFSELNNGKIFPFRYDRLHDISATIRWHWKKSVEISAIWVYGTGQAVWIPVGQFYGLNHQPLEARRFPVSEAIPSRTLRVYGERNSFRLRPYHRLDLAMHLKKSIRWGERTLSFGTYNTYSRQNPFILETVQPDPSENYLAFKQISVFPIIPFVTYRIEF